MFYFCRYQTDLDSCGEECSMKIIHVSDTHLVAAGGKLHGLDPRERLRQCFEDIVTHHTDA